MDWAHPTLAGVARFSGRCLLIAALLYVLGYIVAHVPLVFLSLFVALLLTSLLHPVADWLTRHRWPRSLAALCAVALLVAVVGGLLAWIVPQAASQIAAHSETLAQRAEQLVRRLSGYLPGQQPSLSELGMQAKQWVREHAQMLAQGAISGLTTLVSVLGGILLALVLTFFFVRDGSRLARAALSPLPAERRQVARAAAGGAWRTLSGWVRGTVLVALIDAVGIGLGLLILGVPLALPLALLMFLSAFVPVLGAIVAGGIAVLVAWATGGTQDALITLGIVLAVQQLEGNVLQPVIMGRVLPLHAAVVLLAVTAGVLVAGIAGALVAVPLLAAVTAGAQAWAREARKLRPSEWTPTATVSPPREGGDEQPAAPH